MIAVDIIARIAAGDRLHMQFTGGRTVWWFENPHQLVPHDVIARLLDHKGTPIREAGDSLFGLERNSQTWIQDTEGQPNG